MRIAAWNVNGMRAAIQKGIERHLDALAPDVVLFQEVRATPDQLPTPWAEPPGWHVAWHPAQKKGYAGTAVWSRTPIAAHTRGLGDDDDPEGRVLVADLGPLDVVSVYLPSGASGPEKQANKEAWMARFLPWARARAATGRPIILGGDMNIAHTPRDIWNAKGNEKNSGFLPHERAWFTELLGVGWHDALRAHLGPVQGPYSWWSNRGNARALDRGWRIDYLLVSPGAQPLLRGAGVSREGGLEISDHAPIWVDLDLPS